MRVLLGFSLASGLLLPLTHVAQAQNPPAQIQPLTLPATPRLWVTDADIPNLKTRIQSSPELNRTYTSLISTADSWLKRPVSPPDHGGQWYHWYSCKKDGSRLTTVSKTEHVCPICKTVYTGWPYDDVVVSQVHDDYSRAVFALGLAYRFTRKPEYAAKTREILLAYAEKYPTYLQHDKDGKPGPRGGKIGCQKLDEATWAIPVFRGADLIWDTLSATDRSQIETGLIRPLVTEIRLVNMKIHNIQCWMNSAVGLAGLLLNDPEYVYYAVDSPSGFKEQIAKGITEEGQWYEGAWGYHFYAMNAMTPLTEAGRLCGLNLYDVKRNGRSFRSMFEAPLKLAMPNQTLPAFNDSNQVSLLEQGKLYEIGLARYGDPTYAAVLRGNERRSFEALIAGPLPLPPADSVPVKSQNYPETGYAVIQHGTGPDATWLCLKYGPHGGGHGHPDKLNFVFYGGGQTLAIDSGTANYGVPIQNDWYKSSLAHNTLVVDQTNQKPATGSSLAWVDKGDATAILADAGPIHDNVKYRRAAALFGKDLLVVLDIAESATEHTYDFAYHNAGKWMTTPTGDPVSLGTNPGYIALRDMVKTVLPLPVIQAGTDKPVPVSITTASTIPSQLLVGTGVGRNTTDRIPCLITRVQGTNAAVAWAISLNNTPAKLTLETPTPGTFQVTATQDKTTHSLTVTPDGPGKLEVR